MSTPSAGQKEESVQAERVQVDVMHWSLSNAPRATVTSGTGQGRTPTNHCPTFPTAHQAKCISEEAPSVPLSFSKDGFRATLEGATLISPIRNGGAKNILKNKQEHEKYFK